MTKDRPRNRPGDKPKSGGFRSGGDGKPDGGKPWRGGADRPRAGREDTASSSDKPWERDRRPAKASGGPKPHGDKPHSDGGERFGGKPSRTVYRPPQDAERRLPERGGDAAPGAGADRPRGDFRSKPNRFRDKPHGGPRQGSQQPSGQWDRREAAFEDNGEVWIWGTHAAAAALANPKRRISKAFVTRNAAVRAGLDPDALPKFAEMLEAKEIDQRLAPGAAHQGIAVRCAQIDGPDISDVAERPDKPLVILDQVTDPQNVGAVFRSAAAFGIAGVVMQTRNAPLLGGALAKAAAGAIEQIDDIRAVNLSRAIDALTDAGWKVIGLDGSATQTIEQAFAGPEPLAIVLGAEGAGIRQGVARACTGLARIAIGESMESLNVSNAAAIAFYEAMRRHGAAAPPAKPAQMPAADENAGTGAFDDETE